MEVLGQRGVDQDRLVQGVQVRRDGQGGQRVEPPERVALLQDLALVPVVDRARDDQEDVVDHVAVRDVLHELGQRVRGLRLDVVEVLDELLVQLLLDHRRRERLADVCEEVPVVRCRELELEVLEVVALCQVDVLRRRDKRVLVSPHEPLDVPAVDVEEKSLHCVLYCDAAAVSAGSAVAAVAAPPCPVPRLSSCLLLSTASSGTSSRLCAKRQPSGSLRKRPTRRFAGAAIWRHVLKFTRLTRRTGGTEHEVP